MYYICIFLLWGRKQSNKTQILIHYGFNFYKCLTYYAHMHKAFGKSTGLDFPSKFCVMLLIENVLLQKNAASPLKLNILIGLFLVWITHATFCILWSHLIFVQFQLLRLQCITKTIWIQLLFFLNNQSSWHAHDTTSTDKINNFMHSTFMTWFF